MYRGKFYYDQNTVYGHYCKLYNTVGPISVAKLNAMHLSKNKNILLISI